MSILNRTNDGLFNVLIVLYIIVHKTTTIEKERLLDRCVPGSLDRKMANQTLNRWQQLGLFKIDEDQNVSIAKDYNLPSKDVQSYLPSMLRTIVLDARNNENFWDSEKSLSADFTRGLSWLLAQDIYKFDTQNHATVQSAEFEQIRDANKRVVQNDTRWAGLREWMVYLGFGWEADNLVIDPTIAVQDQLAKVFSDSIVLAINDFLARLSVQLPVVDTGKYRQMIEAELDTSVWHKADEKFISTSLSRAIKRLEFAGKVRLEKKADAEIAYYLSQRSGLTWGDPVTHIAFIDRGA